MTEQKLNKPHQGRNIKRFREVLGLKQEALALMMGEDWNQKRISLLEGREVIDSDTLTLVASVLKIPEEAIMNLTDEGVVNIIANTFNTHDNSATIQGSIIYYNPTFNPIDKLVAAMDENKELYERLLKSEQEKVEILRNKTSQ